MVAVHPQDATTVARQMYQNRTDIGVGHCLIAVRTYLGIPSYYGYAMLAWADADYRHQTSDPDTVPFGAPCFTNRVSGPTYYGHIMLAGGRFRKTGERIFWTTDQHGDGRITPVPWSFLRDSWGHELLGWTGDLNRVRIPFLSAAPTRHR